MIRRRDTASRPSDQGTILIVALVFLLVIGVITAAVAQMAVGASANTTNARIQQTSQADVESEVSLAIQATRSGYDYAGCSSGCFSKSGFSSASNCTPGSGISGLSVWCEGSGGSENGVPTRTVDFYVCQGSSNCAGSATAPLYAEALYEDLPSGEPLSGDQCTATLTSTCGITVSLTAWDVRLADS
jgi:hypothetical protein